MESTEVDIKPTIPVNDIPDKSSPVPTVGKLKNSRYEDVWPEDVHAAFMEAVALYPPMGKRRLKYYRVSTCENKHSSTADRTKSFGRCQLIQSYILEKTGKNRSRKQVSSHLQRLKKIHKDNPAMQHLFSERSQLSSEHYSVPQAISSQDIVGDSPDGARHLKSDSDPAVNFRDAGSGDVSSSTFTYASEGSSFTDGPYDALSLPTNFCNQLSFPSTQEFLSSIPQQCPGFALHSSDSDYLPELQDAFVFKSAVNEGFRSGSAFNTSAFSTSMRRLASKLPMQNRPVESGPTMHFSRAVHSLGFQPAHQWISHDDWTDGFSCNSPLTLAQEGLHAPFYPLQPIPSEKGGPSNLAPEWLWPKIPDPPLDSREGTLAELRLRYPPTMYQYNPLFPEMGVTTPLFFSSPPEGEVSRLSRGLPYSYSVTNAATVSESAPNGSAIDLSRQSPNPPEDLAPPLVIRPTPVYPISYTHSDIHLNVHSDSSTPAPCLLP